MKVSEKWFSLRRVRRIFACCAALCGVLTLLSPVRVSGAQRAEQTYQIVMLLDESGSMLHSDKNYQTVAAANMFVDSLFTEISGGRHRFDVSLTVQGFTDTLHEVVKWTRLSSWKDADAVAKSVDEEIKFVHEQPTDLGKALNEATKLLSRPSDASSSKNMIILFTDGYIDKAPGKGETQEDVDKWRMNSISALEEAKERARKELNCEAYVIGLIQKDDMESAEDSQRAREAREGAALIRALANDTQTGAGLMPPGSGDSSGRNKVNYIITENISDVQNFYIKLFAAMTGGAEPETPQMLTEDGISYYPIDTRIPGITSAMIYILADGPVSSIILTDPNEQARELRDASSGSGHTLDFQSAKVQVISRPGSKPDRSSYYILTIPSPEAGIWKVSARSDSNLRFDVRYVMTGGFDVILDQVRTVRGSPTGTVIAHAALPREEDAKQFYDTANGICYAYAPGQKLLSADMRYDSKLNGMTGTITVPTPGDYRVYAVMSFPAASNIEGEKCSAEQTVKFALLDTVNFGTVSSGKRRVIGLRDTFISGWDALELTIYDATARNLPADRLLERLLAYVAPQRENRQVVQTTFSEDTVDVTGNRIGRSRIEVSARDNVGAKYVWTGIIAVNPPMPQLILAGALPILLLVAFVALLRLLLPRRLPGWLKVDIELGTDVIPRRVRVKGRKFRLYKVVKAYLRDLQRGEQSYPETVENLKRAIEACRADLQSKEYEISIMETRSGRKRSATYVYGPQERDLSDAIEAIYVDKEHGTDLKIKVSYTDNRV